MKTTTYTAGIYCRLSKDDNLPGESMSIGTQRSMIEDYCKEHGYLVYDVYIDDGYSGLNFNRPDFQRMLADIDRGLVNLVITKDLSRLGRDYIMTGYYTEIYFPSNDIRYIALSDGFDTENENNDIAPFKNILNDMYARDISRKVKAAKRQQAKQGLFTCGQTPFGYMKDPADNHHLIVDPDAAQTVQLIFDLAMEGLGDVGIAHELQRREIIKPAVYKFRQGDKRYSHYGDLPKSKIYNWCDATIRQILTNQVYLGHVISHKTEVTNYKTKKVRRIATADQIVVPNRHEAIIPESVFFTVQTLRKGRCCPVNYKRENLFRDILFCKCCGSPLAIAHRKLKYSVDDLYRCMKHLRTPQECPKTHAIYHAPLYAYVLSQMRSVARSLKRRKVNSPITAYAEIGELTPEVLHTAIERIEIGHVTRKSRIGSVVKIQWKLG